VRAITHIVIHCSATENGAEVRLEDIDRWHCERGWKGCGYHYVIERDGALREGRALQDVGAHVAGSNAHSIGICMVGTDRFAYEQWETLRSLVAMLTHRFRAAVVLGHRDFSPDLDGDGVIEPWEYFKLCPGFSVAEWRTCGMAPLPLHLLEIA
jgi:N-acetyl-anhydromuramyl-L-alanine amidase AmpD